MNQKWPSLIGASLALLCVVLQGTSAEAQVAAGYSTSYSTCCTMNLPTERDDCGNGCGGFGHRGWYQRNFGSNYPTPDCYGRCGPTVGLYGSCHQRPCGRRVAHRSCCPTLVPTQAPACCGVTPNCSSATPCAAMMTTRRPGVPMTDTVAFELISKTTSIPADPTEVLKSEI